MLTCHQPFLIATKIFVLSKKIIIYKDLWYPGIKKKGSTGKVSGTTGHKVLVQQSSHFWQPSSAARALLFSFLFKGQNHTLKTFLLLMIQHIPFAYDQEHHLAISRKWFQHGTHCTDILIWQVMAFWCQLAHNSRIIYIPGHSKEMFMCLNFVFATLQSRHQLLMLIMTQLDKDINCIFLHLDEVSQDHSG